MIKDTGIGRMLTNTWPKLYKGEPWGFDNGAYGLYVKGLQIGIYETESGEGIGRFLKRFMVHHIWQFCLT